MFYCHRHTALSIVASVLLLISSSVRGTSLSGKIADAKTKEPLAGVRVAIVGTKTGAVSGLNGSYIIRDILPGSLRLRISYPGYVVQSVTIEFTASEQEVTRNFDLAPVQYQSKEILVVGKTEYGSETSAQKSIQNSDAVLNVVSAKSIEVSPDLSVSDVSQRISGVSISRSSGGDGEYAIIRGMDKRYNYTLVNGIKIPSPDNKNRYVPLDIFPAELLDRLEVSKTLLPSMEGDAIGGSMNLIMRHAPDRFIATANAASGYDGLYFQRKFFTFDNSASSSQSPRLANGSLYAAQLSDFPLANWDIRSAQPSPNQYYGFTIGNRFFEDKSLGAILSASYQNYSRGANTIFFTTDVEQSNNTPKLLSIQNRAYSTLQIRTGAEARVDYIADPNNTFDLFGMFASLKQQELRDLTDTSLELAWQGPGTGRIIYDRQSTVQTQNIGNLTLAGNDIIFGNDLEAHWDLVYSKATLNEPDRALLDLSTSVTADASGNKATHPIIVNLQSPRRWISSSDQDKSGYLTFKSTENIFGLATEFSYGGMYRNKTRSATYDQYVLRPGTQGGQTAGIQYYNGNIARDTFWVYNPLGSPDDGRNYDAHENVFAGFLQARAQIGDLIAIGGARIERTDFGWLSSAPETVEGKRGSINYQDILPSLSLKFSPVLNQNWRLSYFKSISRPGFTEVIPNTIPGDDYDEVGNPYLKHIRADNLDARWEYFPSGLDQILAGVFYKYIQDPIEYALKVQGTTMILAPDNFGTATNYGFELDVIKYFSAFGVKANYTFTKSQITTTKSIFSNGSLGTGSQTRPLQGQSEHIANLSLLYKDFESGTDAQLSAVYTGPHIVTVSPYKDNDIWENGYTTLDLSGEQRIGHGLSLYFKVNNILNAVREETIHTSYVTPTYLPYTPSYQTPGANVLVRSEHYDRTYMLGLRFKL